LELNDAVQSLIDAGDWLGLLGYYWAALDALPYAHVAVIGGAAFLVGLFVLAMLVPGNTAGVIAADKPLPKVGGQGFIERRRSPARFERPLTLYGRTYETYERLIGIASIPGTGKSSILAEMMWQSGGRCIVVSGGKSPPLIDTVYAMGGRHWETTGRLGVDLLDGDYRRVPQVLEHIFPRAAGDGDLFRGLFRQISRDRIKEDDEKGISRSIPALIEALRKADPERYPGVTPQMRGNWIARMNEVVDSLGPALGTDLNLLEACKYNVPVLFTLDKRRDPSGGLRRMFAAAAISAGTQAVAAGYAPMFLIDELGLLDADAIAEDARTFREAGVLFAAAAHGKQDFGQDLRSLIDFWIFGTLAADEPESRRWASETTFGTRSSESFGGHALPKGHFVVWDGSRVQDDLVVPRYTRREWLWSTPELPERLVAPKVPVPAESVKKEGNTEQVDTEEAPRVCGPVEMPRLYLEAPVAEKLRPQLVNIWLHHAFPRGMDGCHESTYRKNNSGRPGCSLGGADWTTYILVRVLQDAIEQGMSEAELVAYMGKVKLLTAAGQLSVDHVEGCENEVCDRPDHLAWESVSRNSELYHERKRPTEGVRGVGAAAD
jgi:hypothetical protein